MPAGLALLGAAPDVIGSLPSWSKNAPSDIFYQDGLPAVSPDFSPCEIWPTKPPRAPTYCETSMLSHPLVLPVTAREWKGSPPVWFATDGAERLADGAKSVAQTAARQGVVVHWEEHEAMPHLWPMLFKSWPQAQRCWQNRP